MLKLPRVRSQPWSYLQQVTSTAQRVEESMRLSSVIPQIKYNFKFLWTQIITSCCGADQEATEFWSESEDPIWTALPPKGLRPHYLAASEQWGLGPPLWAVV